MKRSGLRSLLVRLLLVRLLKERKIERKRRRGSRSFHRLKKRWIAVAPVGETGAAAT